MSTSGEREQRIALDIARGYASNGYRISAQFWVDRAEQFHPVSARQLRAIHRILEEADW